MAKKKSNLNKSTVLIVDKVGSQNQLPCFKAQAIWTVTCCLKKPETKTTAIHFNFPPLKTQNNNKRAGARSTEGKERIEGTSGFWLPHSYK